MVHSVHIVATFGRSLYALACGFVRVVHWPVGGGGVGRVLNSSSRMET